MKKIFFISLLFLLVACKHKNEANKGNIVQNQAENDTVLSHTSRDKSFIDFFEVFMWDKNFQKLRVIFPVNLNKSVINSVDKWVHLPFYSNKQYIPILCSDTVTCFEKDIETKNIEVFILNFGNKPTLKYNFRKETDAWFLVGSEKIIGNKNIDTNFIDFIERFSKDSIFQLNHTQFPFKEVYADADRDYETVDTLITKSNWKHINLVKELDGLMVLSSMDKNNKFRNIYFRGVENGISIKYVFEKVKNEWIFIKLEDCST